MRGFIERVDNVDTLDKAHYLPHRDNIQVDNVISRHDQETEIINSYQESRSIMNEANFNLRS